MLVCSNVQPCGDRRSRSSRRGPPDTRRAPPRGAACASPTRPWPGAGTFETLVASFGRSCGLPTSSDGAGAGQLHTLALERRLRWNRCTSGRKALLCPARRRAIDGHRPVVVEPAFPQLPRTRRSRCRRFFASGAGLGYSGPLSLEVFNDEFRAAPARLTARDGLRPLILAEAEAGGGASRPTGFRRSGVCRVRGRRGLRRRSRRLSRTSRFRRAGRHRSKAVDLFRQGRINLLLNSEPDSAASYHFHCTGRRFAPLACGSTMLNGR